MSYPEIVTINGKEYNLFKLWRSEIIKLAAYGFEQKAKRLIDGPRILTKDEKIAKTDRMFELLKEGRWTEPT